MCANSACAAARDLSWPYRGRHGQTTAARASHLRLVAPHVPRRGRDADLPRPRRPASVPRDARANGPHRRVDVRGALPDGQPLPPDRQSAPCRPLHRHALAERRLRPALQPPLRAPRPPLRRPLRILDRGDGQPSRGRYCVRPAEPGSRRPLHNGRRLAVEPSRAPLAPTRARSPRSRSEPRRGAPRPRSSTAQAAARPRAVRRPRSSPRSRRDR
jgi:hypothetical protein